MDIGLFFIHVHCPHHIDERLLAVNLLHRHVGLELELTSLAEEAGVVQRRLLNLLAVRLAQLLLDRLDHLPEEDHLVVNLLDILPGQDPPGAQLHVIAEIFLIVLGPLRRLHIFRVLTGEECDIYSDVLFEFIFLLLLQFIEHFLDVF